MNSVHIGFMSLFHVIFCQIGSHSRMIGAKETIIIHISRLIVTRLSLAVDSIPVRMLVQQFRTVHRPLPIVGFQAGFLAHAVNVFIITFKSTPEIPHSFNSLNHCCQSAAERPLGKPVHTQFSLRAELFSLYGNVLHY